MTTFIIVIHVMICALLVGIILMQSGRGGGLTEGFAAVESAFGAKTNEFLIKGTTIFAALFLATCLSLAFLSSKKTESLMAEAAKAAERAAQNKTTLFDEMDLPVIDLTLPSAPETVDATAVVPATGVDAQAVVEATTKVDVPAGTLKTGIPDEMLDKPIAVPAVP